MFSSRTDAALLMVQAEEAQWVIKADGYLRLEAWAGVMDSAVWDLVVWCKPGWDKNVLNVTFLRLFLMSEVELWTLFQRILMQYNNHSTICYS
jgi:hypothetical protein